MDYADRKAESAALFDRLDTNLAPFAEIRRQLDEAGEPMPEHIRQVLKEALFPVLTAVIPVLLPLREVVPELAYLHREERVHSKTQLDPYDLCTQSEREPYTISKLRGDLVPVPCCCRGTATFN